MREFKWNGTSGWFLLTIGKSYHYVNCSMKRFFALFFFVQLAACAVWAQTGAVTPAADATVQANNTAAAAAIGSGHVAVPHPPEFLELMVDKVLAIFDVRTSENTPLRWGIAGGIFLLSIIVRRLIVSLLFSFFRKLAAKTKSTLDDKLFDRLETPVGAYIIVIGVVCALKTLKLEPALKSTINYSATVAFSLVTFWLLLRAFSAVLDHMQERAVERKLSVAAFMPWIKKSLVVIFIIFGVLMIAQSMGVNVKAFLAGLGIGGLAFALAAQDTLANVFGSVVVAVDQPFKIGEVVQIGAHTGTVEDIGLRSTKIRKADRTLVILPNKTVAAEIIINLSKINVRRGEQMINLTYDTKPEQLDQIIEDIRAIVVGDPAIDPASVVTVFNGFNASSIDILVAYMTKNADMNEFFKARQRISTAIMRAVAARGLEFAFPTQTVQLGGEAARKFAEGGTKPAAPKA